MNTKIMTLTAANKEPKEIKRLIKIVFDNFFVLFRAPFRSFQHKECTVATLGRSQGTNTAIAFHGVTDIALAAYTDRVT